MKVKKKILLLIHNHPNPHQTGWFFFFVFDCELEKYANIIREKEKMQLRYNRILETNRSSNSAGHEGYTV